MVVLPLPIYTSMFLYHVFLIMPKYHHRYDLIKIAMVKNWGGVVYRDLHYDICTAVTYTRRIR